MRDRFIHAPFLEERVAEIVLGFGKVGPDGRRLLELKDGLVPLSFLAQRDAEIVMSLVIVGMKFQRLVKLE